ncbi:MAG: hypothetical protein ACP5O8_01840 [Candidatus Aenigmatarchaeota archaeon]
MKTLVLIPLVLVALLVTVSVGAARLERITETQKLAFTQMIRNYFSPVIHGWGIGFDCQGDSYITAKFHVLSVKILPYDQVVTILREEMQKSQTVDWSQVRERIRAAIEENGTIISKGRISVNGTMYALTNIVKTDTSFSADIKELPNYESCKQQNISAEQCEQQAQKIGSISLTKGEPTGLPGTPYLWKGTLDFKGKTYKFGAFAYPRAVA